MITWTLASGWTLELLRAGDGTPPEVASRTEPIPAIVPGCVHTDLLAAGLIPDPLLDENEARVQWIGESDWRYRCRFTAPEALLARDRIDLHCEGLDTVAEVRVNGVGVGRAENMHRPHRFDVAAALHPGENELVIDFRSPLAYAREQEARLGERPRARALPYNFVRKMASNFGSDWGPTLVTAAVWRQVRLEAWNVARIRQVRPWVRLVGEPAATPPDAPRLGQLEVHVDLERTGGPACLRLHAHLSGRGEDPTEVIAEANVCAGDATAVLLLEVPEPRLWWPAGYGAQPLYDLSVTIHREPEAGASSELDRRHVPVGFRTVELDTSPDEAGAGFGIVVNGRSVFARGADWIPDDPFPSRVDGGRLRRRLAQAADANMNMVRVWGGGVYESDAFYDACDELGLLVWQDFAFAGAAYPEEEPFRSEVEAEARANVVRLMPHPSLALWNGNDESLWGHEDRGWETQLNGRSWGRTFYLELLPRLVARLDPTRPYWAGSPWSGREDIPPNADGYGCTHVGDGRNDKDDVVDRDTEPRFVARFGRQAPPTWATVRAALPDDTLDPDSPGMRRLQKAEDGDLRLRARLAAHFPPLRDFDAWLFAAQLDQARAVELEIRHFRALAPHCMGALVWQLNDCWPATSWAAVDAGGRRKPLWYALRRVFTDRLLSFEPGPAGAEDGLALVLHNDSDEPWRRPVRLRRVAVDGKVLADQTFELAADARGPAVWLTLPPELAAAADAGGELLVADAGEARAVHFFASDKALRYPTPDLATELAEEDVPGGGHRYRLTVHARTLLRDLCLFPDRLQPDAVVDGALVTLLPGESHVFTVESPVALARARLSAAPVLVSANDLVQVPVPA